MKKFRKTLCLFLALVMCLGMVNFTAFADEAANEAGTSAGENSAAVEVEAAPGGDEPSAPATPGENGEDGGEEPAASVTPGENGEETAAPATPGEDGEDGGSGTEDPAGDEVPAEVQAFLDAVAELPDTSEVTPGNAGETGVQANAVLDLYEGLIDAGLDERDDVTEALETVYAVYEAVLAAEEIEDSDTFDAERTDNVLKSPYQNYAPNTPNGPDLPVASNGQVQDLWGTVRLNSPGDSATAISFPAS